MKILVAGDTHGNTSAICNVAIPKARKEDCDLIVQVGDFGYWEHLPGGVRFLNKVQKRLMREDIDLFWIDGNHENHPLLWEKYPPIQEGAYAGLSEIRPNIFYVPRGHILKIGPANCLFVGGAYSIDKDWRIQEQLAARTWNTLWWDTEMITDSDIERSIRHIEASQDVGLPIDLMFTHDVPIGIDIPGLPNKDFFPESTRNRLNLRSIFDAAQPKMLVHGHYHERYTGKLPLKPKVDPNSDLLDWGYCRVDGLGYDGHEGFAIVLDLDSLFVAE